MNQIVIGLTGKFKSGKTTVAKNLVVELAAMGHTVKILSFAAPLKAMADVLLRSFGMPEEALTSLSINKFKQLDSIDLDVSYRYLLQTLGTDWGRRLIDEDIWIKAASATISALDDDIIIFDDVRFPNELEWISGLNGMVFKLLRTTEQERLLESNHASEAANDNLNVDETIDNNGRVSETCKEILRILKTKYMNYGV